MSYEGWGAKPEIAPHDYFSSPHQKICWILPNSSRIFGRSFLAFAERTWYFVGVRFPQQPQSGKLLLGTLLTTLLVVHTHTRPHAPSNAAILC